MRPKPAFGTILVRKNTGRKTLVAQRQDGGRIYIPIAKTRKGCGKVKTICISCTTSPPLPDTKLCSECLLLRV